MSLDEYNKLNTEFDPASFQDYDGVLLPWKVWKGNEIIFYIAEKFEAVELTEHKNTYHPPCHESAPFLLNDGRVILVSSIVSATIFESEDDYLNEVGRWPKSDRVNEK